MRGQIQMHFPKNYAFGLPSSYLLYFGINVLRGLIKDVIPGYGSRKSPRYVEKVISPPPSDLAAGPFYLPKCPRR